MNAFTVSGGGGKNSTTTENFSAENIKTGVTVIVKYRGKDLYKVLGTFTSDANAVAADILNTKTAYVNGSKVTGNMPNIGAVNYSLPINGSYSFSKGYHNGSGRVTQSIPTQGAQTITPSTSDQRVTAGRYLTGDITVRGDGNLVAGNIKSGVSIFGVWGNLVETGEGKLCVVMENGSSNFGSPKRISGDQDWALSWDTGTTIGVNMLISRGYEQCSAYLPNPIDLTNYRYLCFMQRGYDGYTNNGYYIRVGVVSSPGSISYARSCQLSTKILCDIAVCDISDLRGNYYIAFDKQNCFEHGLRNILLG